MLQSGRHSKLYQDDQDMGMAGKALRLLSEVSDVSVTCPAGGRYSGYMLI